MATDPYGFGNYFTDVAVQPAPAPQVNDAQLQWIAAINGQTPDEYLRTQSQWQANGGKAPPTPFQTWQLNGMSGAAYPQSIYDAQQAENSYITNLGPRMAGYNQALGGVYDQVSGIEQGSRARADALGPINAQMGVDSRNSAAASNAMELGALGNYQTAVGNAGAWDMANYNNLVTAANAPMQMSASPYVGDAMSNPADVARQMQVFGQLQGAANGSLDQVSQAAQAYANAQDVANQQRAAATLEAAGNGALNVDLRDIEELDKLRNPGSIEGMQELYNAYKGSNDVSVGQLDPEAYGAAVDARNQLKALTSPEITAQERLTYELSRQQQEQDERASREAAYTEARRRGMGGVGTEIARSALGAQQTSRNRMLQDMAANAQAQQRAMAALEGYGTLSTNMTAQANQIALQNAANQLSALGQYTGVAYGAANTLGQLGAANATANSNRQLAAQEAAYQAYATLRAQGFSEEYARGQAADVMATANADRRLGAMNSSANLSTNMRNASDSMSMFNQGQRQQQSQFSDLYTASRQDAQFNRSQSVFDAGNTVGRNYMSDQGNLMGYTQTAATNTDNRTQNAIQTQRGLNNDWMGYQGTADSIGMQGAGIRTGIIGQQQANNERVAAAPVAQGRQQVQDALVLKNIGTANENDRNAYRAFASGAPIPPPPSPYGYTPYNTTYPM